MQLTNNMKKTSSSFIKISNFKKMLISSIISACRHHNDEVKCNSFNRFTGFCIKIAKMNTKITPVNHFVFIYFFVIFVCVSTPALVNSTVEMETNRKKVFFRQLSSLKYLNAIVINDAAWYKYTNAFICKYNLHSLWKKKHEKSDFYLSSIRVKTRVKAY